MTAFTFRMPSGIPGNVARIESATIEAQVINTTTPPTRYGDPVAYASAGNGGVRPITTGDVAATICGFLVRPFPTQGGVNWPSDPLITTGSAGSPPANGICNILRAGYISVMVNGAGTASNGSPVYIRVATPAAGKPIGGIEAASDTTNTIIAAHCEFTGAQDAQGNCEIRVFTGPQ